MIITPAQKQKKQLKQHENPILLRNYMKTKHCIAILIFDKCQVSSNQKTSTE